MCEIEKINQNLLDTYNKAVEAKDVTQFLSNYDPDFVVFDMWGNQEYQEREAWKTMVQQWFDSQGNDKVTVDIRDVHIISDQNITGFRTYLTFTGVSDSGKILHTMDNRFTWILKNQNGNWKVIPEYSSTPIDFESNKVIWKGFTTRRNETI